MTTLTIIALGVLAMAGYGLAESAVTRIMLRRRLERRIRRIGR